MSLSTDYKTIWDRQKKISVKIIPIQLCGLQLHLGTIPITLNTLITLYYQSWHSSCPLFLNNPGEIPGSDDIFHYYIIAIQIIIKTRRCMAPHVIWEASITLRVVSSHIAMVQGLLYCMQCGAIPSSCHEQNWSSMLVPHDCLHYVCYLLYLPQFMTLQYLILKGKSNYILEQACQNLLMFAFHTNVLQYTYISFHGEIYSLYLYSYTTWKDMCIFLANHKEIHEHVQLPQCLFACIDYVE